ncbi:30S ribosomal protein S6 [Helcococcus ovis]|uniref:Small ribosomal subunit protein bS6 n=2 Tax=Helcococcus TaxID=31983 RepID=A0A4R9C262_9FIRM|nr:30S ribosomal protein S6 [Helcococcus ovis]TFF66038.1 30S ribosomal protein S6 [Helcococcus ovis]TFF66970.1 30S ribosomal protein S6 [Helcococcus ovis]TFF68576.1 30S ribosomal protein S6 [Helcococcus ovis]WNZ01303.1 30S ribosomal protein S6 [Helcococcus ovis]
MNNYEMIVILKPNLEEELKKDVLQRLYDVIDEHGKLGEIEDWGNRKLAYEIQKLSEGNYVLINFEAEPSIIKELERRAQITDQIIKYLVVNKES